ncbi:hypothetical protein HanRHA438_Chr03g0120171 [Helianthus annuus]|nr:hypothetical protein HanRHA438_Chr03g0120171 [Helianthus annuus]
MVCGGMSFGDFQWRLAYLLIPFRGLGLYSADDVFSYAFVASRSQSWSLQDRILWDFGIDGLDFDCWFVLGTLHKSLPDLDFGGFINKDTPKTQNILVSAIYSKTI